MSPTPAKRWREPREVGVEVTLPSGKVARIRPFTFETLLRNGRIPDGLVPIVVKAITGEDAVMPSIASREDAETWLDYYDAVCRTCFVMPKVVDEPLADNEISVEDIELGDKVYVSRFLNEPADRLARFHQQQKTTLEPVESKQGHGDAPQSPDADTGVGV